MIRHYQLPAVKIPAGQATSGKFSIADFAWGSFQLGTLTGTAVTFLVSNDGINFAALNDNTGTAKASVSVASGQITPFPDELFYHSQAKIVSNATEGSDVPITLLIKG